MGILDMIVNRSNPAQPSEYGGKSAITRPQTVTEYLDSMIEYHELKIAQFKAAKADVSPEVERALNALSRL